MRTQTALWLSSVMPMSELNRASMDYAYGRLAEVIGIYPDYDDVQALMDDYEDYERNSWLTTQE